MKDKRSGVCMCVETFGAKTSSMPFVTDLRDAIHAFHFAARRLLQLPTPQVASRSSHNHRAGQRCLDLRAERNFRLVVRN